MERFLISPRRVEVSVFPRKEMIHVSRTWRSIKFEHVSILNRRTARRCTSQGGRKPERPCARQKPKASALLYLGERFRTNSSSPCIYLRSINGPLMVYSSLRHIYDRLAVDCSFFLPRFFSSPLLFLPFIFFFFFFSSVWSLDHT